MMHESAVEFETKSRIHMGLGVENLSRSVAFYRILFGQEPTKTRVRYAKFEVARPPVNLALNEMGLRIPPTNPVAHFGIQVKSTAAVREIGDRFRRAGYQISVEESVTCCYAVQNKMWATDPDGNKWEVYVVVDNDAAGHPNVHTDCCQPTIGHTESADRGEFPKSITDSQHAQPMSACSCLAARE